MIALLLAAAAYVVQPGDTCARVAAKIYGDARAVDRVHSLNPQLGPPPHHLVAGSQLSVAPDPDARLTYVKPDVNHRKAGGALWGPAAQGEDLFRLDQVNTLRGAGAEVTFRDQTALQIRESALVVINGSGVPGKSEDTRSGQVSLVQGELRMKLAQLRGEKPVTLGTPAAKVSARSRDLLLAVDEQKMSRVSVYDGVAEVSAGGKSVHVPEGSGTRVENGKAPEKPRPLPAAPRWSAQTALFRGGVQLAWGPVERAAKYLVVVARDERFLDVAAQAATAQPSFDAPPLPPGTYLARVQAQDDAGLTGAASEPRRIVVALAQLTRVPGEARFTLDAPRGVAVLLDGKPATTPLVVHAPGDHVVAIKDGADEERLPFELLAPPATAALTRSGDGFDLAVALAPALPLEPLSLETAASAGPISRGADGAVHAHLTPPAGSRTASVDVLWGGRRIAQATGELPAPEPIVAPPPLDEPEVSSENLAGEPTAVEADTIPVARPTLHTGVRARLQPVDLSGFSPRFAAALDLRAGQSAMIGVTASTSPGDAVTSGSVSALTLRLHIFDERRFFSAGVALTVPTTSLGDSARARLHAGTGVVFGALELSTTQALGLGVGSGARPAWDSAYVAKLSLRRTIAAAVEVDAIAGDVRLVRLGRVSDRTLFAPVLAAGLRARFGSFEAGLSVRTALSSDAEAVWGRSGALLQVGFDAGAR